MPLWVLLSVSLDERMFTFLWGVYPAAEMLSHRDESGSYCQGISKVFREHFTPPKRMRVRVVPHPCQHLELSVFLFNRFPISFILQLGIPRPK